MAYLVLARKWRPKGFDAITGQEHVTRTLRNAIAQNRLHHAFLFCGARGVGKTSAARVLAKALNCQASDGPTANACGECSACREISAGTSVDVFEIDGASNRGIGEIRELRDGVAYAPQRDRYKVYIIDEVHMLTTEAFNALLKTLEEPPAHVKFIFATTEPHKIPVTILSRCQRFDFKRIPMPVMVQRLSEILEAENVRIDEGGLRLVARESEGSMRDALSLLDRVISACGSDATYEGVANILGVADRAWLNRLVMASFERDAAAGLKLIAEVFEYGVDLRKFVADLVHHLRDLAMIQVAGDDAPTELAPDEIKVLKQLGQKVAPEDVQRLVRMAAETAERLVQASFPRLEIEMLVIRMCRLNPVQPLEQLLQRLMALERRLTSGEPLPPRRSHGAGGDHPKADAQAKDLGHSPAALSPAPSRPLTPTQAVSPAPSPAPWQQLASVTPLVSSPAPANIAEAMTSPMLAPTEVLAEPIESQPVPASDTQNETRDLPKTPLEPVVDGPLDTAGWVRVVQALKIHHPLLAGALDHLACGGFAEGVATLDVSGDVTEKRIASRLDDVTRVVAQLAPSVKSLHLRRVAAVPESPHQLRVAAETRRRETIRSEVAGHPIVLALQSRLGGVLGDVEIKSASEGKKA